jgi:peroxiredoxin Q/BCP
MLKRGDPAPGFALESDTGERVTLDQFRGRKVVLYFYPKDGTSGCTTEACEFRDHWQAVQASGAVVLGISPDSVVSHRRFKGQHRLPFPLLADPDHQVAETYGAWGEKRLSGRRYHGILRTTYVIDREGRIARVFTKVKPRGHASQVLAALREIE